MPRVRLTYAKRGRSCFVPHIAIPSVFSRSGARAGIPFTLTGGFTPRARISLGPELPVGIPALAEPFEVWVSSFDEEMPHRWNRCLPPGFVLTGVHVVSEESESDRRHLSKHCEGASCLLTTRRSNIPLCTIGSCIEASGHALSIVSVTLDGRPFLRCILEAPSRQSPAVLIKMLVEEGAIGGWADIFLVREAVGYLSKRESEPGGYFVSPLSSPLL